MLTFSKQALADLDQLWLYIAEQDPQAADAIIDHLQDRLLAFYRAPEIGSVRPDLWPDAHCFSVGKGSWRSGFLVFYRINNEGIEISHILEGHRDISPELFE